MICEDDAYEFNACDFYGSDGFSFAAQPAQPRLQAPAPRLGRSEHYIGSREKRQLLQTTAGAATNNREHGHKVRSLGIIPFTADVKPQKLNVIVIMCLHSASNEFAPTIETTRRAKTPGGG